MSLRLGFVSVMRPLFKGDSAGAAARSLAGLRVLGKELDFELFSPAVAASDPETATQAARELQAQELDFLLIQHSTFATSELLLPLLRACKRVGVWALPESAGNGSARGPLPLNSLCGLNMTLSFLDHPKLAKREPVKWFYGEMDSAWFRARLEPTLAALRALKAIEGARILQIGGTAPGFYGIEGQPALAAVKVDKMELAEVFVRVAKVSEADAKARAADWQKEEAWDAPTEHLERAAKVELTLKDIAEKGAYDALALRCWPEFPDTCGVMVCAAVGRMGDAEIPTACEGDVMGALSMLALQALSKQPTILMDLSDLDLADDSLQFWHCGNAPMAWAATPGTRLTTHFNRDGLGVVRDMVLRPGPTTGLRLLAGGKRAVIVSGEFAEPDKAGFDGVRGWLKDLHWQSEPLSARAFIANVLDYRLPHHLAFATGDVQAGLSEFCAWLGAEVLPARPLKDTL